MVWCEPGGSEHVGVSHRQVAWCEEPQSKQAGENSHSRESLWWGEKYVQAGSHGSSRVK